eukprot:m.53088 g.53088  ORF g.53088 m.53088 type:complete len:190 (+) comp9139_c0_seq2:477-1046(+)
MNLSTDPMRWRHCVPKSRPSVANRGYSQAPLKRCMHTKPATDGERYGVGTEFVAIMFNTGKRARIRITEHEPGKKIAIANSSMDAKIANEAQLAQAKHLGGISGSMIESMQASGLKQFEQEAFMIFEIVSKDSCNVTLKLHAVMPIVCSRMISAETQRPMQQSQLETLLMSIKAYCEDNAADIAADASK